MTDASESHRAEHTADAISARLDGANNQTYIRDVIYGAIDGAVTTLAIVAGVEGAGLSNSVVIVLGVANLVADGFSMAASNFLGIRAEEQARASARQEEHRHIVLFPEGEREEVRQIFARKGFEGDDLERAVSVITSNAEQWVNTMLQDEHGLALQGPNPWRAAMATFIAFFVVGSIPLLAFVINAIVPGMFAAPFLWSAILTAVAFFGVGALKGRYVNQSWYLAGSETLAVGGLAAALAYVIGALLHNLALGL